MNHMIRNFTKAKSGIVDEVMVSSNYFEAPASRSLYAIRPPTFLMTLFRALRVQQFNQAIEYTTVYLWNAAATNLSKF